MDPTDEDRSKEITFPLGGALGYIERLEKGVYSITEKGKDFLKSESA